VLREFIPGPSKSANFKLDANKTVTDIDGNVYNKVLIGNQVWLAENLKTTKYNNGDLIGTTSTATLDLSTQRSPKYQWSYEGNESNVDKYGRLYTWFAATDSRNLCPSGWHIPSNPEWQTLINFLNGSRYAGDKLKEAGRSHWQVSNGKATNSSGFTALPGGYRFYKGNFLKKGYNGYWMSTTNYNETTAWIILMGEGSSVGTGESLNDNKFFGCSVRCLKD